MPAAIAITNAENQAKNLDIKKVTWLELFFDLIFALALAMSAKPLEEISAANGVSWGALGQFVIMFLFLVIFWYRHMQLINRFSRSSFLTEAITLTVGFLVVAFTQFIRVWQVSPVIGSYLATITISLATILMAVLYVIFSFRVTDEGQDEKRWARASAKRMFIESVAYMAGILISPGIRPFWFIAVFIYFNKYPFHVWINPKAQNTLPAELKKAPPEHVSHKSERIGLFSLLVYGLIMVLAATPLMEIELTLEGILGPIIAFGQLLLFISLIWYIHYKIIELTQPKGNQFVTLSFIVLALLVSTTQFLRVLLITPTATIQIFFAVFTGLLLSVIGVMYWNVKTMAGTPPNEQLQTVFRRWAYLIYIFASAMFVSILMPEPIRLLMWRITGITAVVGLLVERGLSHRYHLGTKVTNAVKYFDTPTMNAIYLLIIGVASFFVTHTWQKKSITSIWILFWVAPLVIGFFVLINHWLHKRIK